MLRFRDAPPLRVQEGVSSGDADTSCGGAGWCLAAKSRYFWAAARNRTRSACDLALLARFSKYNAVSISSFSDMDFSDMESGALIFSSPRIWPTNVAELSSQCQVGTKRNVGQSLAYRPSAHGFASFLLTAPSPHRIRAAAAHAGGHQRGSLWVELVASAKSAPLSYPRRGRHASFHGASPGHSRS